VNIDAFHAYVLPNVIGCPVPVMDHHVRLAAIDFCNKTRFHEAECEGASLYKGVITAEADAGLEIVSVSTVHVDGERLANKTKQTGLSMLNAGSTDRFYVVLWDGEIAINPIPQTEVPVRVVATFRPTQTATVISDVLTEWMDDIASGAIARIAALPGQAFSNPEISGYHMQKFNEAVKSAKVSRYLAGTETAQKRKADVF
jgi:hypothetical protein